MGRYLAQKMKAQRKVSKYLPVNAAQIPRRFEVSNEPPKLKSL